MNQQESNKTIYRSPHESCPACIEKKRHTERQWAVFHPNAGEGFSKEHGSPLKTQEKEEEK